MVWKKIKIKWFTLVELIIVITILAILATIAFISFNGYIKNSRDSNRVSTLNSIKKWLEIFAVKTGNFPSPDEISWSGYLHWVVLNSVGNISESISRNININKPTTDPLTWDKYKYGVNYLKTEYQIASVLETSLSHTHFPLLETTYAASSIYKAKVDGNYKGYIIFSTGWNNYIGNIPSLLYANTGSVFLASTGTYYIVDKKNNLPYKVDNSSSVNIAGDEMIQQITNNSASILTGVNITNITADTISNVFTWNILSSFWGNIDAIKTNVLWVNPTPAALIPPANCNYGENGISWVCRDPYWNNVILMMHFDGASGSTNFTDEKWNIFTNSTTVNTISTSKYKFWNGSVRSQNNGNNIMTTPHNADFNFLNNNFTIEWWLHPTANTNGWIFGKRTNSSNEHSPITIQQMAGTTWPKISFFLSISNATWDFSYTSSVEMVVNTWNHFAIVREGSSFYLFMNGQKYTATTSFASPLMSNTKAISLVWVSLWGDSTWMDYQWYNGYMDEFRVTKWIARYTTWMTIPEYIYPNQ